jgi:CrcB protein
LTTERLVIGATWRTAVGIGFLGSFTTFSTYAYESVRLAQDGALGLALLNTVGMVALGLGAAVLGRADGLVTLERIEALVYRAESPEYGPPPSS